MPKNMMNRIERDKRDFLAKYYRLPNVIVLGYALFDELVVKDMTKRDGKYRLAGMSVLVYPESQFKNDYDLLLIPKKEQE